MTAEGACANACRSDSCRGWPHPMPRPALAPTPKVNSPREFVLKLIGNIPYFRHVASKLPTAYLFQTIVDTISKVSCAVGFNYLTNGQ